MVRVRIMAALSLVTLGVAACSGTSPSASTGPSIGVAGGRLGTAAVVIQATDQDTFNPATQKVTVGEIIEWKNMGSVAHNIIVPADASINDPVIEGGGGVWQVKFTTAGTYQYSCTIHTGMVGTIIVSSG